MYTIKHIWKALMLLCMLFPIGAVAEEQWCAVTDNNHIIALSHIGYLASTPGETKFNVVLNDGTAIQEVESMIFAKFHVNIDGLEEIPLGTTTQLSFAADKILISNAPFGAPVTISTIEGRNIISSTIESESQQVDISSLAKSVYILNVGGKSVKFRRL